MTPEELKTAISLLGHALKIMTGLDYDEFVTKDGGVGYAGPGYVRGLALSEHGAPRVLVGHVIAGGQGEFFHVYTPGQISVAPVAAKGDSDGAA